MFLIAPSTNFMNNKLKVEYSIASPDKAELLIKDLWSKIVISPNNNLLYLKFNQLLNSFSQ